jgi:hypothetical protein
MKSMAGGEFDELITHGKFRLTLKVSLVMVSVAPLIPPPLVVLIPPPHLILLPVLVCRTRRDRVVIRRKRSKSVPRAKSCLSPDFDVKFSPVRRWRSHPILGLERISTPFFNLGLLLRNPLTIEGMIESFHRIPRSKSLEIL